MSIIIALYTYRSFKQPDNSKEKEMKAVDKIVTSIESLTDSLETTKELDHAWREIQKALGYLSAKDSMYKYKETKND